MLGAVRVEWCSWRRGGLALLALLGLSFGGTASAQLNVLITKGIARPVPMAIVPFGWSGAGPAAYDIAGVVSADLKSSGRFAPIPESDMVSRPTQPDKINFADWRLLKVDYIVIGTLTETAPDQFTTVFQLFDVLRGEQILGYRFMSARVDLRATAHRISDMIFEKLVGIPGVFSTQIAYVSEEKRADGKRFRLIVSDADGENAHIITDSPQPLLSPSWSPDGRRLAYASFEGDQQAVYVQTLKSGTRERVSGRKGVNSSRRSRRMVDCSRSRSRTSKATSTSSRSTSRRRCCGSSRPTRRSTQGRVVAGRPHAVLQLGPLGGRRSIASAPSRALARSA